MTSPWAAPGAAPPQPSPGTEAPAGRPGPPARPDTRSPEPLEPVPVELGPMTLPDLLDGAFAIVKRRPREVLTLAAAFVIPIEVLSTVLLRDLLDEGALTGATDPTSVLTTDGEVLGAGAALTSAAAGVVSLALLAGALGVLVDGWYRGRRVGAGEAIAASLRRAPALIVAVVLVKLLELVGLFALGIGAYVAMALCHVVSPAVTVERLGPFAAVRRSVQLTRRRILPALAAPGMVGLVGMLVALGFQAVPEVGASLVPEDWGWLVRAAGQLASQLVVVPFTAGVAVLFHLDLRIRNEALDIELRSRSLLGSPDGEAGP
jgi:hypothetical protein